MTNSKHRGCNIKDLIWSEYKRQRLTVRPPRRSDSTQMPFLSVEQVENQPREVFWGCGPITGRRVAPTMYPCKSANYQIVSDRARLSAAEHTIRLHKDGAELKRAWTGSIREACKQRLPLAGGRRPGVPATTSLRQTGRLCCFCFLARCHSLRNVACKKNCIRRNLIIFGITIFDSNKVWSLVVVVFFLAHLLQST